MLPQTRDRAINNTNRRLYLSYELQNNQIYLGYGSDVLSVARKGPGRFNGL